MLRLPAEVGGSRTDDQLSRLVTHTHIRKLAETKGGGRWLREGWIPNFHQEGLLRVFSCFLACDFWDRLQHHGIKIPQKVKLADLLSPVSPLP